MAQLELRKIHESLDKTTYRGVKMMKFPFDYLQYQMIINDVKPDLIIEIGTLMGGAALYYADLMDTIGIEGGEVHTIDVRPVRQNFGRSVVIPSDSSIHKVVDALKNGDDVIPDMVLNHPRIKCFEDGWENYDIGLCKGKERVLIFDDGSHHYEAVLGALNKLSSCVTKGSYYIVEDGNVSMLFSPQKVLDSFAGGPTKAIIEFLETNDDFKIDFSKCDFFGFNSTYNTYGYLKRVK